VKLTRKEIVCTSSWTHVVNERNVSSAATLTLPTQARISHIVTHVDWLLFRHQLAQQL